MNDYLACSVIVPSYCSASTICACVTSLLGQDIQLSYEIIVVDSSPDDTPDLVRRNFPQVTLIHLPRQTGPEEARNIGVGSACGEMLAFIDSDCVAPPDWLRSLHTAYLQGHDAVGGSIVNGNGTTLVSWAGYMCEFREFLPGGAPRQMPYLTLGNAAYRHTTFLASGGFPRGCYPLEDQIFHRTLRDRGVSIHLDPRIVVAHMHRTERNAFAQHQRRIGRANAQVLLRLDLPGAGLVGRPWLAALAIPLLILFRFVRTLAACWRVERALVLRRPALAWLCLLGMCWWGRGFLDGAAIAYTAIDGHNRRNER
jgi:glycosyltransferase involved in cell wall biosynthesis